MLVIWIGGAVLVALLQAGASQPGSLAFDLEGRVNILGESRLITSNPAAQIEPAISGDIVAFTDMRHGNADIYYHDLATGTEHRVTDGAQDERDPDVWGGTIVYTDFGATTGGGDIMGYVIGGDAFEVATDAMSAQTGAAIGGSIVAWEDTRDGNPEIYARDLVSGVEKRVTTTLLLAETQPFVDERRIVFRRAFFDGTCQIFLADFDTLAETRLSVGSTCFSRPSLSRGIVVYDGDPPLLGNPEADLDVFVQSLETREMTRVVLGLGQWAPRISGPWLAADKEARTPVPNNDVKLYNIPNEFPFGAVISEFNESANDLDRRTAVYQTDETGNLEIAVYEFIVGDNAVPVADTGPDRVIDCSVPTGGSITLNGSASSDADEDILDYTWTGAFPEGNGTMRGVAPTVTLPLGTSQVALVVSDTQDVSGPDTQEITIAMTARGLPPALTGLAREGNDAPLTGGSFRRGSRIALRLQVGCGDSVLGAADIAPPRIVALSSGGNPVDLESLDTLPPRGGDPLAFRSAGRGWFLILGTRSLETGDYSLSIETPDGTRHVAAFTIR